MIRETSQLCWFRTPPKKTMRRTPAPTALFIRNRARLREKLPPGALVIVHSNDVMPSNADGTLGYKQNSDFFHLTGIDQEESVLVMLPDATREENRELLFVRETNEHVALWEGRKLTKEDATRLSGIKNVRWTKDLEGVLRGLFCQAEEVFLALNEHTRAEPRVPTRNDRFVRWCKENYPLHTYRRLAPLLTRLRMIKQPEEIEMMRKACDITTSGFKRLLGFVRPGVGEWEIESELVHEFTRLGSKGFAYSPIVGSGANACVLHYVENADICQDGQMVLLDVAAEYYNWNADLTRTIPVNGKFSPRQRAVYDAVLRVFRHCETILRPGILLSDYQKQVIDRMELEMIGLGLFTAAEAAAQSKDKPLVKKYFPHGTSHHLGLDVHDVNIDGEPVAIGMVFTIEPGIYIPEENLGVRIENDYLIGETGNINLLPDAPIEADDIEAHMAAQR